MDQKKILFVFAHPDDETFTSGVTIVKYIREEKTSVSLLCATRGEAGKPGEPPICTPEELPAVREQELYRACEILGIQQVDLLDYKDKHLSDFPVETLASDIRTAILRHQPQVVITFAPHGISGHPDHQAISAATSLAVRQLPVEENPVKKFYYVTHPTPSSPSEFHPAHTDPYESITTVITAPQYVSVVAEALLAHRTQHLSVNRVFPGLHQGNTGGVRSSNHFILDWTNIPGYQLKEKETDLFAGLPYELPNRFIDQ